MKIKNKVEVPFEQQQYTITLTGQELAHIWYLSYTKEEGDEFPVLNRIHRNISQELAMSVEALKAIGKKAAKDIRRTEGLS